MKLYAIRKHGVCIGNGVNERVSMCNSITNLIMA